MSSEYITYDQCRDLIVELAKFLQKEANKANSDGDVGGYNEDFCDGKESAYKHTFKFMDTRVKEMLIENKNKEQDILAEETIKNIEKAGIF